MGILAECGNELYAGLIAEGKCVQAEHVSQVKVESMEEH